MNSRYKFRSAVPYRVQSSSAMILDLGPYQTRVEERIAGWMSDCVRDRLWQKDPTIWVEGATDEVASRLGWLNAARSMHHRLRPLTAFVGAVGAANVRNVVVIGEGGLVIGPHVLARTLSGVDSHPDLIALDTTHPSYVRSLAEELDLQRTLFVISGKGSMTQEMRCLYKHFWTKAEEVLGRRVGKNFAAITNVGSSLDTDARKADFRNIFHVRPDLDGSYSVLSEFGILPLAMTGADFNALLNSAEAAVDRSKSCKTEADDAGIVLGAVLAEMALAGRDKLTFVSTPSLKVVPAWIEQLVAESTTKSPCRIVPVTDEPLGPPQVYGDDRLFVALTRHGDPDQGIDDRLQSLSLAGHPVVRIGLDDVTEVGAEIFRWQVAVALASSVLGVNPFDEAGATRIWNAVVRTQPIRDGAQQRDTLVIESGSRSGVADALLAWLANAGDASWLAIQAYLAPDADVVRLLQEIRIVLRDRLGITTTVGFGRRLPHINGQFSADERKTAFVLQLCDAASANDLPAAGTDLTFGQLTRNQADNDYDLFRAQHRDVLRCDVGQDVAGGLEAIATALRKDG